MASICGTLSKIKYFDEASGFTIALVNLEEETILPGNEIAGDMILKAGTLITVKGNMPGTSQGMSLEFHGYWMQDSKWGLQFNVARLSFDEEARSMAIDLAVRSCLSKAVQNGDTYVTEEYMLEFLREELSASEEEAIDSFSRLTMDGVIMADQSFGVPVLYLESIYLAETRVCSNLLRLNINDENELSASGFFSDKEDKTSEIGMSLDYKKIQKKMGIELSKNQKEAIEGSLQHPISVITGGPGTGKTTIIRVVFRCLRELGNLVAIAAPTGRAAKRIKESTGYSATTIHRLLEATVDEKTEKVYFRRDENNPLEYDAVIIDEASMIDINLMDKLLLAMGNGTRLILVGDCDQLPPVGPGSVLRDIIDSGYIHNVVLTEIFRQASESKIITAAHEINRGEYPIISNRSEEDLRFIDESIGINALELIASAAEEDGSQVIAPSKKSMLGVENLNRILQERLNPPGEWKNQVELSDFTLREGDRVMQIKNNYSRPWKIGNSADEKQGLFNGDMGIVKDINLVKGIVKIDFDDKISNYELNELKEINLSYAITVHKSQGSEFDKVIMPINMVGKLLGTRNLLYTAITRARKSVLMVGSKKAMHYMIDNNTNRERNSGLKYRLNKLMEDNCQLK